MRLTENLFNTLAEAKMAPKNNLIQSDKELWKKIKRNGHFSKQKRKLIASILTSQEKSPQVQLTRNFSVNVLQKEPIQNFPSVPSHEKADDYLQETNFVETIDDSESDNDVNNFERFTDPETLYNELRIWAIDHQIKHTAINSLLSVLKNNIYNNNLPKDARTLVQTPRITHISSDYRLGGQYWHYGLVNILNEVLSRLNDIPDELALNVNIDGLPTFKSSSKSFWPILVDIHEIRFQHPPFVAGIFCGNCKFAGFCSTFFFVFYVLLKIGYVSDKPRDVNAFLEPFVEELNDVLQNGLKVKEVTIKFRLRCFICDTPARSMLRGN